MALSRQLASKIMIKQRTNQDSLGGGSSGGAWNLYNQTVNNAGSITLSTSDRSQVITVVGSGGAVVASVLTPFSGTAIDGAVIRIVGGDLTNTVTLTNSDTAGGLILNGNITLALYDMIELQYFQTLDRYVEVSRNQ